MTTPPYGNPTPPDRSGGHPQNGSAPSQQYPPLTEEMLIDRQPQREKSGWFRNPFASKKAARSAEPAPPNPWVAAAPSRGPGAPSGDAAARYGAREGAGFGPPSSAPGGQGSAAYGAAAAPQQKSKKRDKRSTGGSGSGKAGKQGAEGSGGNGWFRNPFAKSGPGSPADRGKVSTAQMWSGPRRGILFRRLLGVVAVCALLYLAAGLNGKADRGDVEGLVRNAVKPAKTTFPKGDAVMWAAPLVKAFATYDSETSDQRQQALKPYAINGLDSQLGWNGQGKQTVLDMVMSSDVQTLPGNRAIVRSTVQVQDGSWRCVSVPVYAVERGESTAFGLSAAPVYTSCAGLTTPPPPRETLKNDEDLAATFQEELLPPFMAAWVQSDTDNLKRYLLPGVSSFGLGGAYAGDGEDTSPQIDGVVVPEPAKGENPDRRTVTFSVTLTSVDGEATQESQYEVPVAKRNGQWYFASDPVPVVDAEAVGGEQVPEAEPSTGTGEMYEDGSSPAPYPNGSSTGVQQPDN